jgi:hypothetical protein
VPELEALMLFVGLTASLGGLSLSLSMWLEPKEAGLRLVACYTCGSAFVSSVCAFAITTPV